MANLKRNMIKLVKNTEEVNQGAEVEFETFWTVPFLPLDATYEAADVMEKLENMEKEGSSEVRDMIDLLADFTANTAYGNQFTKDELKKKLHAPDALRTLQEQIMFVAQGQQTDETKKFLEKKN